MSAFTSPILIEPGSTGKKLQRISLAGGSGQYSEQWLQESTEANGKIWIETRPVRYQDLDAAGDRERVIDYLNENANAMVNVFRHRLEALQRQQEIGTIRAA